MRKTFAFLAGLLLGAALCGGELSGTLNIADAIPGGEPAVRILALTLCRENPKLTVNIRRMNAAEAMDKLAAGEAELIFAEEREVAASSAIRRRYAAEAAIVIVNAKNLKTDFSIPELRGIFTGSVNDWMSLNGSAYSLHRMGVADGVPGAAVFIRMVLDGRPLQEAVYRRDNMAQLLALTAVNANTIAFVGYPDMRPGTDVREVAVNGIVPSDENLKSGRYPLMAYRTAVIGSRLSAPGRAFFQLLKSADFRDSLRDENLFPLL